MGLCRKFELLNGFSVCPGRTSIVTTTAENAQTKPGSEPASKDDLKSLPMPDMEAKLGSSPDGLSQAEAQKRLTQYGPNEIEEKKTNPFLKFLSYFWGPIPWMIEVAAIQIGRAHV